MNKFNKNLSIWTPVFNTKKKKKKKKTSEYFRFCLSHTIKIYYTDII